jgi:hypothetical protein
MGLSGGRDAVLPPDRLNSPGWDECEFISRDALKQGSKARCVFQRELLSEDQNNIIIPAKAGIYPYFRCHTVDGFPPSRE